MLVIALVAKIATAGGVYPTTPVKSLTVPVAVAIKGRQAVTDYLLKQVESVTVQFSGNSLVGNNWNDRVMGMDYLSSMGGYVHRGQFTELSDAIASTSFSGSVVQTPEGYYDVRVTLTLSTSNGATAFNGSGSLNIWKDGNGHLNVGNFNPLIDINQSVSIVVSNYASAAKWTGKYGRSTDLQTSWDGQNTTITIPVGYLDDGFLLYADGSSGAITGWNMNNGSSLTGQQIFAVLGQTQSGAVTSLRNPAKIDAGYNSFYNFGNPEFVGRFPLLDVVLTQWTNIPVNLNVPVWGVSQTTVSPSHVYVTPIYLNDGGYSGLKVGQEYDVTPQATGDAKQLPTLPPGGYHIRTVFDNLIDWTEYNGQGGAVG